MPKRTRGDVGGYNVEIFHNVTGENLTMSGTGCIKNYT